MAKVARRITQFTKRYRKLFDTSKDSRKREREREREREKNADSAINKCRSERKSLIATSETMRRNNETKDRERERKELMPNVPCSDSLLHGWHKVHARTHTKSQLCQLNRPSQVTQSLSHLLVCPCVSPNALEQKEP